MAKPRVRIAVLAGGLGTRLGGAKPTAMLDGRPLLEHVLEPALETGLPVAVVAKPGTRLPPLGVELLLEPQAPAHPLAGIATALERAGGAAVLALACDTPFLPAALLSWLAARPGAVVLRAGGRLQPLPGRYPADALPVLRAGLMRERPLRDVLMELAPRQVAEDELRPFGDPARICFNVNDEHDLRAAEVLASASG